MIVSIIALIFSAQTNLAMSQTATATSKLMGQTLTVSNGSQVTPAQNGVSSLTQLQFLGGMKTLLDASTQYTTQPEATLYVAGMRVWNGTAKFSKGSYTYTGGIAPLRIAFPVLAYPVGPLILQVVAGVDMQANIQASLTPGVAYPLNDSSLMASLSANAAAAAFVEGSATLLFVRAGVGGSVEVINGLTTVAAQLYYQIPPILTYGGKVTLLSGDVYAFVDSKLIFGSWKRWWSKDLFKWNGKCFAFGSDTCALN